MTDAEQPQLQGIGIGLRIAFGHELIQRAPASVQWLEIHPENYVRRGGRFQTLLHAARAKWPIATHGLSLSLGAIAPHDRAYVTALRGLIQTLGSPWYSDHLCFGSVDNAHTHDLLPIPRNEESIGLVVDRVGELREALGVPIAIENVSYYADSTMDEMSELTFLQRVLDAADARMLLDVNNVWVNSVNHGFDPSEFIRELPLERVVQMHVAGHWTRADGLIIDTHAEPVCDGVYALLRETLALTGPRPVLLERDGKYPPLDELLAEVDALDTIYQDVFA